MSLHDVAARALHVFDPEDAHGWAIRGLKLGLGPRDAGPDDPILAVQIAGLALPNCVGLAAGFDKNAEVPDAMLAAGFGFVEAGTVTPLAQAGNPRPRLFRLTEDRAVINRMGFNNEGLEPFARRLAARSGRGGVDYVTGLTRLWGLSDYFTANISSPNTPGLRALQTRAALEELLGRLAETRAGLKARSGHDYPIFLKVAPDLEDGEVEAIVETVIGAGLDAIIVSNTTIARPDTLRSPLAGESGGLSGAPLLAPSTAVLGRFHAAAAGRVALIGAGGVASGADAYAKIRAGARALQLYSALVYGGPGLVTRIKRDLAARLRADGFVAVQDANCALGEPNCRPSPGKSPCSARRSTWPSTSPPWRSPCPVALILSLTGGFLFGPIGGGFAAVTGATGGSTVTFLVFRTAFGDILRRKPSAFLAVVEAGFRGDAFNYLLTLRLIPAFPLLIVNIAAGLMNVRAKTFVLASLLGMIPSSFVYAGIGAGLGHIFAKGGPVTLETLLSPRIYLPIIGMGVLAFLPPLWRHWRKGREAAPLDEK
ncbi:Quinone-dependent dihydroorotate dehydrogenase [Aphelenchoides fujianensis]|nr:Quinone-dependent dihydroorotate dehydrogenase [Aphelenchoides fujianensis]